MTRSTSKSASPTAAAPLDSAALRDLALASLDDDKATDIVAIDLIGKSSIADVMVVATGTSSRQVAAMADHLVAKAAENGLKRIRTEGLPQGDWVLVDLGDVIVHLFRPEVRAFYRIEEIWGLDRPITAARPDGGSA